MSRYSRISTIWRKELVDILRDRRTLIAMVLVPIVLYPALMLGSVQAFELQFSLLRQECYNVGVQSDEARRWLRRLIDEDPARQELGEGMTAEQRVDWAQSPEPPVPGTQPDVPLERGDQAESMRSGVRHKPPPYEIHIVPDVRQMVTDGVVHIGVLVDGPLPPIGTGGSTLVTLVFDESETRSNIAAVGLQGIFERANTKIVESRLAKLGRDASFIHPLAVYEQNVASAEKMAGSILGQIVPLILVMMTITGAIYPAIDLTAGERERGTLETLMVAPVPTTDLIAGKFIVVTLIGLLSAVLNLLAVGGTIYLGGLGDLLTRGGDFVFPLEALPCILLLLIPLAVMFSAMLLAVCSFARSFKEAQNYIMPVMIAALIPAVVGVLPGTRLEGPLLVMPVANIVILTRELFLGHIDAAAIVWVALTTTIYAGAAVAVAAKLFGQESVQFADSASIKTVFQRRFFKPLATPTIAQALLILALVYPLNFFIQQRLMQTGGLLGSERYYWALAAVLIVLFVGLPWLAARYMRVNVRTAFRLERPRAAAIVAALCFGCSTWILAHAWFVVQEQWLPMPPPIKQMMQHVTSWLDGSHVLVVVLLLALVPAVCEELFFRGYVLSGVRGALGKVAAVLLVALVFAIFHQSVFRLVVSAALGLLLGLLVVQWRSVWPAVLAHFLHNGLAVAVRRPDGLQPLVERLGYAIGEEGHPPPMSWIIAAAVLVAVGVLLCLLAREREYPAERLAAPALESETASQP
jgi:sodium transport system permease protein